MEATSPASSSSEPASGVERLAFDGAVHDVATTRRIAGVLVVIGAALLAALARTSWAYVVAALALVAARFWARRIAAASGEERALAARALELGERGVDIPRPDGSTSHVAWTELRRIEIDHERLLVVLRLEGEREVEIEPSFGGLGLDALARRIEAHRPR